MKLKTLICFMVLNVLSFAMGADTNPLPKTYNYKLDLKIDYKTQKLYGTCEITISNETDQPIQTIPILLYRLLTVRSVHDHENIGLPFTQNVVSISGWEQIQVNFIEISLNNAISRGEQTQIEIEYEGYLFGYSAEGWRYVRDHIDRNFTLIRTDGFGYPVVGYPNDRDMMMIAQEWYDYAINITVPAGLFVITGGRLIDQIKTDDETTFIYYSKKPSWRMDIAVSDYQIFKKGENEVYYFPSDSLGAQRVMTALDASYELYTGWFGPLDDYQGFSVIEVPEGYSSQKDITAIILSAENFSESNEMLTIYHEIAHSWNVTNLDTQPCRFESEGFAQFLQYLLSEKLDKKQNVVSEAAQRFLDRVRNTFNERIEYQKIPIKDYGVNNMVDYSYTLGMVVFALFHDLAGQDHFNKIIGSFYSAYNDSGATLDEFINHCIELAPLDLEPFFDDWIYTTKGIQLVIEGKSFDELKQYYKGS